MAPPSSNEWKVMALYTEYVNFFAHYMFFPNTARRDFRGTRVQFEIRLTITRLFSELEKMFTKIILAFVKTITEDAPI